MKRLGWKNVLSLVVVLGLFGGAALWFTVASHTTGRNAGDTRSAQAAGAPRGDEVFTGEQLVEFLLNHDELKASTSLALDFPAPTDRFVQRSDDYSPPACRFADGAVADYPGGFRAVEAKPSESSSASAPGLRQEVYQFSAASAAASAFASMQDAVAACPGFVGGWTQSGTPPTSTFTVAPVPTKSGALPMLAWVSASTGGVAANTSWVCLRFANVVTVVRLASATPGSAPLDAARLNRLANALSARALRMANQHISPSGSPSASPPSASAARPTLTRADLADAAIPAVCDHPAGTLVNGALPGIPEGSGGATLTEDSEQLAFRSDPGAGQVAAAVVVHCDMGGVSWPDNIVFYDRDRAVLGLVNLGDLNQGYRDPAKRVWFDDGAVRAEWYNEQPTASFLASGRFDWDGSRISPSELVVGTTPVTD